MRQAKAAASCLLLCLSAWGPCATAEPTEDTPGAAERDADYAAGKAAVEKKQWSVASTHFQKAAARDPDSADLQNYLGYSYRNLKQMDLAIRHYKRAIELNPRHRGAHEYIGETYLMLNDLPNAEKHLLELRRICLLPCEELGDLEAAIARYRARR
jgi:Flp pilus assembly protein TadD